jgi:hypothetical protein
MYKNAYSLLNEKGLAAPGLYTFNMIKNSLPDKLYYLRYNNQLSEIKSHVLKGSDIIKNASELEVHLKNKILIQIEDVILTISSGALYIYDDIVYGEYCEGHPITLLRRGLCGRRFLVTKNKEVFELRALQNWIAKQGDGDTSEYEWHPFNGIISDNFQKIIDFTKENKFFEHGLLLEFLIEGDKIIFCDAKYNDFRIPVLKWLEIFTSSDLFVCVKGEERMLRHTEIDRLDIDNPGDLSENICIYNGALLSHYFTYNINKLKNILFIKA